MTEEFKFRVKDGRIYICMPGGEWESPCLMLCIVSIYKYLTEYRHLCPSMLLDTLGVNDPRGFRYDVEPTIVDARAGKYD